MKARTLPTADATLVVAGTITMLTADRPAPADVVGHTIAIHTSSRLPRLARNDRGEPDATYTAAHKHCTCGQTAGVCLRWGLCTLPTGKIVATATLAESLPMVRWDDMRHNGQQRILLGCRNELFRTNPHPGPPIDITPQLAHGNWEPDRWAWVLKNVTPTTVRCPDCDGEGQHYIDSMTAVGVPGGRYPYAPCTTCGTEREAGPGHCPPIAAAGHAGWWTWTPPGIPADTTR